MAYAQQATERLPLVPDSLLAQASEWIILLGPSDQFFLEFLATDDRLQQLPAVLTNRVILLPSEQLQHAGPSVLFSFATLLKIVHPGLDIVPPRVPGVAPPPSLAPDSLAPQPEPDEPSDESPR